MKATQQEINEFLVGWANAAQSFQDDLAGFKDTIIADLKSQELKFTHSYKDFGAQAFLYFLKKFYDHNEPVEAAIRQAKDIITTSKPPFDEK